MIALRTITGDYVLVFFFSSRRRHTRLQGDWSSDVCSSDLCSGDSRATSWGAPEEVARLSPLQASASYLDHVRQAWDRAHPGAPLRDQLVVLTDRKSVV